MTKSNTMKSAASRTSNTSSSPRLNLQQVNKDGGRHSSLSLIHEEYVEADEEPPIGLISLAAGDRPPWLKGSNGGQEGENGARKLTNGSGAPSRQSEVTFSGNGVGNRL